MKYYLDTLREDDMERICAWRKHVRETLRTPFLQNLDQQHDFYSDVICQRSATPKHLYYAIRPITAEDDTRCPGTLCAMGGLTNCDWVNGVTEISLLVNPDRRGQGIGKASVDLLLEEAFDRLRMHKVRGEVYLANDAAANFWGNLTDNAHWLVEDACKFYNGQHWDAVYFWWLEPEWRDKR